MHGCVVLSSSPASGVRHMVVVRQELGELRARTETKTLRITHTHGRVVCICDPFDLITVALQRAETYYSYRLQAVDSSTLGGGAAAL